MGTEERTFDEDFFESGTETEARYRTYTVQSMLRRFQRQARMLTAHFAPSKVLDIGCAKGFLVLALRDLGVEAFGVDVSDYALSKAPGEISQHLFRVDLNKDELPFANTSFDLVTAYNVLELLDNLPHALTEICRVLGNRGVLFAEIGYGDYYSKAGKYLVEKYRYRLLDERQWIRTLEGFPLEFLKSAAERYYYENFIEDQITNGTGLRRRVARIMASSQLGKSALVNYVKRRSKIGILCFKPRKAISR